MKPESPLAGLPTRAASANQLLTLAPSNAVAELLELRRHAEQALLPALAVRDGTWAIGPTFAGSHIMNADANLVGAGLLLELKTSTGDKRRDGTRRLSLPWTTLLQLVGYMLLDFLDEYKVREVGCLRCTLRPPGEVAAR